MVINGSPPSFKLLFKKINTTVILIDKGGTEQ